MLAIGRALMADPKLLLLDEPSMGLAPLFVEEIFAIITALKERGPRHLLVEQNAHAALDIADYAYVLETGRIASKGSAARCWRARTYQRLILGGDARRNGESRSPGGPNLRRRSTRMGSRPRLTGGETCSGFPPPLSGFAVALALGLLIGLERERSKGVGPSRGPAGIRTFATAALLGAVAFHVGGRSCWPSSRHASPALIAVSYLRTPSAIRASPQRSLWRSCRSLARSRSPTPPSPALSASSSRFSRRKDSAAHLRDERPQQSRNERHALVFAAATLVIFPQLPNRYMGPFEALNPRSIWLLVILVLAIGALGHIAERALGARFGLPLTGLASGFASSTATIGSMAGVASKEPSLLKPAVAAAMLSNVATFVQMGRRSCGRQQADPPLANPRTARRRMRRRDLRRRFHDARAPEQRSAKKQSRVAPSA